MATLSGGAFVGRQQEMGKACGLSSCLWACLALLKVLAR